MRRANLGVVLTYLLLGLTGGSAWAHRPHDVVTQVEVSSQYEFDQTAFVVVRGNLLKSTDGGDSWTRLTEGLDSLHELTALAVAAADPHRLFVATAGDGVYRSDDGGRTWRNVGHGLADKSIDILAVSPRSPDSVFAAGPGGSLYRSVDGGENWAPIVSGTRITAVGFVPGTLESIVIGGQTGTLSISSDNGGTWQALSPLLNKGKISAIAASPRAAVDRTLIVGTDTGGIFKSVNLGASFKAINNGIYDKSIQDIAIAQMPQGSLRLFATTKTQALWVSTNLGATWVRKAKGLTKDVQADELNLPHWGEVRPSSALGRDGTIFLGGFNGLFKTTDQAANWREHETLAKGAVTSLAISPDYAHDSTLAVATYVGNIYISRDRGATWENSAKGLEIYRFAEYSWAYKQDPRRFFDLAFSPNYATDGTLFASVLYINVARSNDRGASWKLGRLPAFAGLSRRGPTIVPSLEFAADKTVYAGTQYGAIYRSTNGGSTFASLAKLGPHNGGDNALSLVISPAFRTDRTLFAAGDVGIHRSVNAGAAWQPITDPLLANRAVVQLAISPNYQQDGTLMAGTSTGLFISRNRAVSWTEVTSAGFGTEVYVEGLAFSPDYRNDQTLLVSTRGRGLHKSQDGGRTFTKLNTGGLALARLNNVPSASMPIRFSPNYAHDRTLFGYGASSKTQVYRSTDGGAHWEVLPVSPVGP